MLHSTCLRSHSVIDRFGYVCKPLCLHVFSVCSFSPVLQLRPHLVSSAAHHFTKKIQLLPTLPDLPPTDSSALCSGLFLIHNLDYKSFWTSHSDSCVYIWVLKNSDRTIRNGPSRFGSCYHGFRACYDHPGILLGQHNQILQSFMETNQALVTKVSYLHSSFLSFALFHSFRCTACLSTIFSDPHHQGGERISCHWPRAFLQRKWLLCSIVFNQYPQNFPLDLSKIQFVMGLLKGSTYRHFRSFWRLFFVTKLNVFDKEVGQISLQQSGHLLGNPLTGAWDLFVL